MACSQKMSCSQKMFSSLELKNIDKAEESLRKLCPNSLVIAKRTSGTIVLLNAIPMISRKLPETELIIDDKPFSLRISEGVNVIANPKNNSLKNELRYILGYDIHLL
jgi:hypothetical protein